MKPNRRITDLEFKVLEYLINLAKFSRHIDNDKLSVRSLADGEMGSFLIFEHPNLLEEQRMFGAQISEFQYIDDDDIPVIVSLNVDNNGNLFELEVWKVDYSPVISLKIPNN